MATKKTTTKKRASKKKKPEAGSRGLEATELTAGEAPAAVGELARAIESDGGAVLSQFRDPLGGHWQLLAALPAERVEPTPFQRDLSDSHVKKLEAVIDRLDRFLDPVIVVRTAHGKYWTPNGHHRSAALKRLGGKSIVCLVLADSDVMYQILALNTEKSPNLKDRSLEVIRMARLLADIDGSVPEKDYALEFDEACFLTLGICYTKSGRFSGSVYQPVLRRIDDFLELPLSESLEVRQARGEKVQAVDAEVVRIVKELKDRGFDSQYLKNFVVARINPVRGKRGKVGDFDETMDKMIDKAKAFDSAKVTADQIGPGE